LHFGILLRRARERRGLSLQDIAQQTRIADRWIAALEEARLETLPAPVFVSGYVRSYARTVGLDERDLVDRYHALTQQREAENPRPAAPRRDQAEMRKRVLVGLVLLLAVLCCLGIGVLLFRHAS
jgi:cytoskeletal protein RodZ